MNPAESARVAPPSLNHKILPPRAHRHAVQRDALLARLFGPTAARVVVFQGPAGHGKTSLMLQARAASERRGALTGWLSLDDSDNDVGRLLGHLRALVVVLGAGAPAASGDDDAGTITPRADWLIGRLLELGQPVALFLDDLHALTDPAALRLLRELITNAPDRVRWFLASRLVPELGLPRLVAGDEARIVSAEDLRFSRDEIRRVFDAGPGPAVSEPELEAIFSGTEGWPAAVQLYRLALGSSSVRDSLRGGRASAPREVADYLAENVLGQQPSRVQSFLLRTSVLSRLSAPLCNALQGRSDGHEMLAMLERDGLFVRRLESGEGWFTYHALFAAFLQEQLARSEPAALVEVHRKAAAWFQAGGHYEEALHHHLSAGDVDLACEVFDLWTDALVPDGHLATVDRWARRLPADAAQRRPGLAVKLAWAFSFLIRHEPIEPLMPVLQASLAQGLAEGDPRLALSMVMILRDDPAQALEYAALTDHREPAATRFGRFEYAASYNVRGFVANARGRFDEALACFARGRELSEQARATFTLGYSGVHAGLTLLAQGHLPQAIGHLRAVISDRRMVLEASVSKACLACALILALYEADESTEALSLFEQFHEMIVEACLHDYLVVCYRAVARLHELRGAPEHALAVLEEAEGLAYAGRWPRAVRLIECERVRRELVAGRVDRAQGMVARLADDGASDTDDWVRFSEDTDGPRIARIRLALHGDAAEAALASIGEALDAARRQGRVHRQIRLQLLAALAQQRLGRLPQAHQALQRAIALAAPGGYVRMFLDEGALLVGLLRAHADEPDQAPPGSEARAFVERLLAAAGVSAAPAAAAAGATAAPLLEPLTKREAKVLAMLADYLSNGQIAERMFVSENTVKFHLKNVYSKLGVKTRLEAIRFVKTHGL
ncbi:MAG TPA: LuxR C-terminal-related transcriptional regulator [Methylibium sp.]|nr:LuxR C-terminal-related transcriptional regulator [Methylibium sp.]